VESKVSIIESKIDNLANTIKLAESKSEIIKWMFIFCILQTAFVFGLIMYLNNR
jgi:hypothetical protein